MDNASSRRIINCADPLWLPFNELAKRLNVSVDGLICEAMTVYYQQQAAALQNGAFLPVSPAYAAQPYSEPVQEEMPPAPPMAPPAAVAPPAPPTAAPYQSAAPAQSLPGAFANVPLQSSGKSSLPPPPISQNLGQRVAPQPPQPSQYRKPPSLFEDVAAPVQPGHLNLASLSSSQSKPATNNAAPAYAQPVAAPGAMPPLYIVFANQRYLVNKDKYIIGRSSQVADLVIRDGNISRKHCAVIYKSGAYYIKDLGSTNGIEYHGKQIDTKRIEEGDQFNICEFYFTFTFNG